MSLDKEVGKIKERSFEFEWEIEDSNYYLKVVTNLQDKSDSYKLKSPKIPQNRNGINFSLELLIIFEENAVDFQLVDDNKKYYVTYEYNIKIYDHQNQNWILLDYDEEASSYNINSDYIFNPKNNFMSNGLNLKFLVIVDYEKSLQPLSISKDLKKFYKSKALTDVTLTVDGQKFVAHKAVLSARSSVFLAMFSNDMIESKTDEVKITDIKPKVFEKLLEYIYSDEIIKIDENTDELLIAADKYDVSSLKERCEIFLSENLSPSNVTRLLDLAHDYSAKDLKSAAIDFITENLDQVTKETTFKDLDLSSVVYREILSAISEKD